MLDKGLWAILLTVLIIIDCGWLYRISWILDLGSARSAQSRIMDRQHVVLPHLGSARSAPSYIGATRHQLSIAKFDFILVMLYLCGNYKGD